MFSIFKKLFNSNKTKVPYLALVPIVGVFLAKQYRGERLNIVFDLDKTLIKSLDDEEIADKNLKGLRKPKIVITFPYANTICDNLDINKFFTKKLYRESCDNYKKDVTKLGINEGILVDDRLKSHVDGQKFYHIREYSENSNVDFELLTVCVHMTLYFIQRNFLLSNK